MTQKVLVIEDDPDVREIVRHSLEMGGFDVVAVEDGSRLGYLTNHHSIDLAIVDLHLPGENGLSLVGRLRNTASMGIIILTGHGEPVDRVVGLELGADDYITKPFEPRELVARVRAVLSGAQLTPIGQATTAFRYRSSSGRDGSSIPATKL